MPTVSVDWLEGRNVDQKREICRQFTETLVKVTGCPPEAVIVIFTEHPRHEIGKAGKLMSD